jgi:hypothetical protein
LELDYALHAVESGKAARGSTVYLGVSAGERVRLAPGGPWVELPKPAPCQTARLQDIDVLFLTPTGEVQLVEVKRSAQALWKELLRTEGRYFDKFNLWRADGGSMGQRRRLEMAIRHVEDGYLDRALPGTRTSVRTLMEDGLVDLQVVGGGQ